jgi:hypothetical protein
MAPALLLYCSLLFSLLLVFLSTPINAQHLLAAERCLDIEPITHRLIVTSDAASGDERSASPLTFFVEEESRIHQITVASSGNLLSPPPTLFLRVVELTALAVNSGHPSTFNFVASRSRGHLQPCLYPPPYNRYLFLYLSS